jgi:Ca2+-binding RTX toxin-like protein
VFVRAFADLTDVTVTGSTDDDTLIVDLSGGDPIPASGISYDGGGPEDNDTLDLTGGTSDSLVYTAFDAHSGTVSVDGKVITYTGLEPIVDDLVVANREFVFGGGNDTINIAVNGSRTTVISPSSESIDFVNPSGPTGTVTIRSGDGDDTIVVTGTPDYALQVDAGAGDNSIMSSVPVAGIITGTSGADSIDMYESAGEVIVSVNGSVSTLSGASSLIVNALEGSDTITLHDLTVPVAVDAGGDIDTLNVDDTGDTGTNEGTLSATGLTGFGIPDDIGYVALENLNIYLGAGDNTINVRSTSASTVIETGGGNDTINLGSQAPGSGGTLNRFVGSVTIDGGGDSDTLNVDDTADTDPNTGTLTATTLTGLGMQSGVGYSNIENLELSLGAGADTLTVSGTGFQTQTRVNTGAGKDMVNVSLLTGVDGFFTLNTEAGEDNVNASSSTLPLLIFGGADNDTIRGGQGDDIILGQQGSDSIYGDSGDDDIYGGHNVENGSDAGDFIDGGAGNDVIVGDNGLIERTATATDPRFTVLLESLIYDSNGQAQVADGNLIGANPVGVEARRILLFDHNESANNVGNFGNDIIAGGADDDVIFGQLGDDDIHGDGLLDNGALAILTATISDSDIGGDDYIEGNGGGDTVYGGLGQDDIIGGSSSLYSLNTASQRPDGADTLYGGNGDLIARNNEGETVVNEAGNTVLPENERHARDADMILGDNGNIYRLVGTNGTDGESLLTFAYDNYANDKIVVRAATLLDYTPGGHDFDPASAANDIGAGDEIRGEAGDDFIYGMVDNDILFGDAQDDDLIGGYGHDWISGGTGSDGVLGDDGRIYTSRNTVGDDAEQLSEPLHGIGNIEVDRNSNTLVIGTPGDLQQSFINTLGELKKSVNLTPFNVDPDPDAQDPLYDAQYADDIIYGGLGGDFLHGGAGDDAISGAEALSGYYAAPGNMGNVLGYSKVRGEFAAYNEFEPLRRILVDEDGVHTNADDPEAREFLLNFDAFDTNAPNDPYAAGSGFAAVATDGDDRLFGDLGNDWLVGGSGKDHLYGGRGDDLLNADDDHDTTINDADPRANDLPDTHPSYEDVAFGGAGRDVLIANTGGDRLIDWVGEFNSYLVPFAPFGAFTISRSILPQLMEYLYDLSEADGADQTRAADTGSDALRNGEPDGEIGLVMQKDFDWQDQTGAPDDLLPGNIPGGARDVIRAADFNNNTNNDAFAADTGTWTVEGGRLQIAPETSGGDAVSVFYVDSALPSYFEMTATINAGKPTAGLKSNTYLIFDYQGPTDFKFSGINISTDKLVMGHRTAEGWIVDEQSPAQLKPNRDYNVLLAQNGTVATLVVNNAEVFSHVYAVRTDIYGVTYGLNAGMVGIGAENSIGAIDNVAVQVLPPELTLDDSENFEDGVADRLTGLMTGNWEILNGRYTGVQQSGAAFATSALDVDVGTAYLLRLDASFSTQGIAGLMFDQYSTNDFKFAALSVATNEVMIGHYTERSGWQVDTAVSRALEAGRDYNLEITLKGTTISIKLDGQAVVGYAFNAPLVDGASGVLTGPAGASFDRVSVQTNDRAYFAPEAVTDPDPVPEINPVETYTNSQSAAIPGRSVLLSTIEVTDTFALQDINVELNISHTRLSDLRVVLVSASGTRVELLNGIGGSNDNFTATLLDDEATDSILDGAAPYTGSFRPVGDLALLEGEQVNGTWTLEVHARKEAGTLDSWSLIVTRGEALLASGTPTEALSGQDDLTETQLAGIVDEAVRRWSDAGLLDADQLAILNDLKVEIADLGGTTLGLTAADTLYIDTNAAGFGWFVDATPADDAEFSDADGDGVYLATAGSEAFERIDLLTVLVHEIGHVLGVEHSESGETQLMSAVLDSGIRLVPQTGELTTLASADAEGDVSTVLHDVLPATVSIAYARGANLNYMLAAMAIERIPLATFSYIDHLSLSRFILKKFK